MGMGRVGGFHKASGKAPDGDQNFFRHSRILIKFNSTSGTNGVSIRKLEFQASLKTFAYRCQKNLPSGVKFKIFFDDLVSVFYFDENLMESRWKFKENVKTDTQ